MAGSHGVESQIVCRRTRGNLTPEQLTSEISEVLSPFKLDGGRVWPRPGHVLVRVFRSDPIEEVLGACRRQAYAYLRLIAWERGGSVERSGAAQCVAGLEGQPLRPITLQVGVSEKANQGQALFRSRDGLVVARAYRKDDKHTVVVQEHLIQHNALAEPRMILNETFSGDPVEWASWLSFDVDRYGPVVRAALRKVDCMFCTHCHYREVEG